MNSGTTGVGNALGSRRICSRLIRIHGIHRIRKRNAVAVGIIVTEPRIEHARFGQLWNGRTVFVYASPIIAHLFNNEDALVREKKEDTRVVVLYLLISTRSSVSGSCVCRYTSRPVFVIAIESIAHVLSTDLFLSSRQLRPSFALHNLASPFCRT